MPPTTPIVFTVDTEEEWDWSSGYPTGPTRTANIHVLPRLQKICDRHGIAVTYFVNHAVLGDDAARAVILELARQPHVEIGMHIHPWNTPPLQSVERVSARESFLHNLPQDLARAKLDTVYSMFAAHGLKPVSFRGGRYSTSPFVQDWLREHGFRADASILPYCTWTDDGAPDYRMRDIQPKRLPGEAPLWEVPLSFGYTRRPFSFWRRVFSVADGLLRPLRIGGILSGLRVVEQAWLNFENPLGEKLPALIRALRKTNAHYLCFTLHSSSLLPGGSPYAPDAASVERTIQRLDQTCSELARNKDLIPMTVAEIVQLLEDGRNARDRD